MGRRTLLVSADFLVDVLKEPGDLTRALTVNHPLPNDAEVVAWQSDGAPTHMILLTIQSEAWDDHDRPLKPPTAKVTYGLA